MNNIKDQSGDRKYFTQIPNLVLDLNLSPLAQLLYLFFKRIAGESGKASVGIRQLKEKFGVGANAIQKAKQELEDTELVSIKTFSAKSRQSDEVKILDIWQRNFEYFATRTVPPQEQSPELGVPVQEQTVPPQTHPVPPQEQSAPFTVPPQEHLEEHTEEPPEEQFKNTPRAGEEISGKRKVEAPPVHPNFKVGAPTTYSAAGRSEIFQFLEKFNLANPFNFPDWTVSIEFACSKNIAVKDYVECIQSLLNAAWRKSPVTPKMVTNQLANFVPKAASEPKRKTAREYRAEADRVVMEEFGA